ncbi:MAG: hypothetical protein QOG10_2350 [Kribbellaceae bacterium]|jgi:hypothetical protein|nr:hypothetical protein [Kribbellaceae bacterium]
MTDKPNKSRSREVVEAVVEGGAGAVPFVGGPLAAALALAMNWSYNKRMDLWLDQLAEAVDQLGRRFEDLAGDEVFVDAVINATRAAQTTHQQEKLDALRHAVVNSVAPGAPDVDEQARFFRLVEQFSAAHLRLLNFLDDTGAVFDRDGRARPSYQYGSLGQLLEDAIPAFAGRRDWYDLLMTDLVNSRLVLGDANSLHGTMTEHGLYQKRSSALGQRFLAFISA